MMKEMDVRVCPHCGYHVDSNVCLTKEDARPENGDISVCVKCHHVALFDTEADGGMRKLTDSEIAEVSEDKYFMSIKTAMNLKF